MRLLMTDCDVSMMTLGNDQAHMTLNTCLDALLYQDGLIKCRTHTTLKLIEETKAKVGEAYALFLEGIRYFKIGTTSFRVFSEAEDKGCEHPILFYFMGLCYKDGLSGATTNNRKAFEYLAKSIGGRLLFFIAFPPYDVTLVSFSAVFH